MTVLFYKLRVWLFQSVTCDQNAASLFSLKWYSVNNNACMHGTHFQQLFAIPAWPLNCSKTKILNCLFHPTCGFCLYDWCTWVAVAYLCRLVKICASLVGKDYKQTLSVYQPVPESTRRTTCYQTFCVRNFYGTGVVQTAKQCYFKSDVTTARTFLLQQKYFQLIVVPFKSGLKLSVPISIYRYVLYLYYHHYTVYY